MREQSKSSKYDEPVIQDIISRRPKSAQDVRDISQRLYSAKTKAFGQGTECKPYESPKTPGEGLKALPKIEGLEERFNGRKRVSSARAEEVTSRLHTAHTQTSRAKYGKPAILLYPEKTLLMTSVESRDLYYDQNLLPKQGALSRREKWFN